nr:hypothetical protein [Tanacetum cinerariifolium]
MYVFARDCRAMKFSGVMLSDMNSLDIGGRVYLRAALVEVRRKSAAAECTPAARASTRRSRDGEGLLLEAGERMA